MGDTIKGLSVSGAFAAQPELKVDPAVKVDKPTTQVISAGDGNPVLANKKAMFNIYLAQGDGKKLFSSNEQGTPMQVEMQDDKFFPVIIKALVDKPQGSRVAVAATVKDVWGKGGVPQLKLKTSDTVLFVLDVLSVEPTDVVKKPSGTSVDAPATAPVVQESGGKVTGLDFSKAPEEGPLEASGHPARRGHGSGGQEGPAGHLQLLRRGVGVEEAVRLLLRPRRTRAVRGRGQRPDQGLGRRHPRSQAGQPGAHHRAGQPGLRRPCAAGHPQELDARLRRRHPGCRLLSAACLPEVGSPDVNLSRGEMTARKSERLLNLLITLLVSRTYVTKDRLRRVVEAYGEAGDDAFEKMFERDKEELRSLGIPIEVGYVDRAFEDEPGYRIERSAFELPDIDLTPQEAAVIGLAARVWQHAGLAAATSDALVKLKAAGVTVDREALNIVQPQLTAEEPAFEPLWDATRTRTPVRFDYRTSRSASSTTRHLQPWGVVSYGGRWYVVGHDTDRGEPRIFRLSRVQGAVLRRRRRGLVRGAAQDRPAGRHRLARPADRRAHRRGAGAPGRRPRPAPPRRPGP